MTIPYGFSSKLGFGTSSTVDKLVSHVNIGEVSRKTLSMDESMIGSAFHRTERTRFAQQFVGPFDFTCEPSKQELDDILTVAGFTESTGVFTINNAPTEIYVTVDLGYKVCNLAGCKFVGLRFSSSAGGKLQLTVTVIGKTNTINNAGTFPSLTADTGGPWMHHESALTLGGSSRVFNDFTLSVDRAPQVQFHNSISATDIDVGDCQVRLGFNLPANTSHSALITTPYTSDAEATGSLVFTNATGGEVATFAMNDLKHETVSPGSVPGRQQAIPWAINLVSLWDGTTAPLVITLA